MTRSEKYLVKPKKFFMKGLFIIPFFFIAAIISIYIYSQVTIKVEAPKKELGEKVIILLPSGENVFTYENLIVQEDGKLYYKGERNTLDLTGGIMYYDEWDSK